jgi:hypothetical protein
MCGGIENRHKYDRLQRAVTKKRFGMPRGNKEETSSQKETRMGKNLRGM